MIEVLSNVIEFRSGESGKRVRRNRKTIKLMLADTEFGDKLSEDEIERISLGAVMHDVWKISVSDQILNKSSRLTPEEYEVMNNHTVKGEKCSVSFLR